MNTADFSTYVADEVFLEWKTDPGNGASDVAFYATLPWITGYFDNTGYQVYSWKDGWVYSRRALATVPGDDGFTGRASTREDATAACCVDAKRLHRLHRWQVYMQDNDPPVST